MVAISQRRFGDDWVTAVEPRGFGRARAPHLAVILATAVLAALANFNFVWNHFYADVPKLFDAGWYAHLIHRNSPLLQNPPSVVFATIGTSYYATHFSPGLWLLSLPSYLIPVGPQVWLASLEAIKYGLLAWIGGLAVRHIAAARTRSAMDHLVAALVVVLIPFNGVLLASIAYPHFESWFVVGAFAFLCALFLGRLRLAIISFVATLLMREDMGFHLCGLLLITAIAARIVRGQWDREIRRWLWFAAAGGAWSIVALVVMKMYFPGDDAFARVYLGDPPLAHLTWGEMTWRLAFNAETRGYLWMPAVIYLIWSAVVRTGWMLIGFAAFVPWLTLNFFAYSRAPGTLDLYYSFPFALALLWPLAGHEVFARKRASRMRTLSWVAVALVASIVGFVRGNPWNSLVRGMVAPIVEAKPALESASADLASAVERGEAVGVDDAVAALAPGKFEARHLFGQTPPELSLAALYVNGRAVKAGWETTLDLPFHYRVRHTPMCVISAEPLAWAYLERVSSRTGSITSFLTRNEHGLAWTTDPEGPETQRFDFGPNWYFRIGEVWTAEIELWVSRGESARDDVIVCELAYQKGRAVVASIRIPMADLASGEASIVRELPFVVPEDQREGLELRLWVPRGSSGRVEDIALRRQESPAAATARPALKEIVRATP